MLLSGRRGILIKKRAKTAKLAVLARFKTFILLGTIFSIFQSAMLLKNYSIPVSESFWFWLCRASILDNSLAPFSDGVKRVNPSLSTRSIISPGWQSNISHRRIIVDVFTSPSLTKRSTIVGENPFFLRSTFLRPLYLINSKSFLYDIGICPTPFLHCI